MKHNGQMYTIPEPGITCRDMWYTSATDS